MSNVEELVAAAKEGDEVAFVRLIDAEARWSYGTARAIVGFDGDAEDVFQEACLRAWRDLPKLRSAEMWSFWFRRIVTNAAIDGARAGRRIKQIKPPGVGSERDPAATIADRDQVFRALLLLAPDERAILVMRFGHDLEVTEVARLMGLPLGTTKSKLHRSLRKLRESTGTET
jgi:RNA polymerase sigma-70 factor (ECF subfamily)